MNLQPIAKAAEHIAEAIKHQADMRVLENFLGMSACAVFAIAVVVIVTMALRKLP